MCDVRCAMCGAMCDTFGTRMERGYLLRPGERPRVVKILMLVHMARQLRTIHDFYGKRIGNIRPSQMWKVFGGSSGRRAGRGGRRGSARGSVWGVSKTRHPYTTSYLKLRKDSQDAMARKQATIVQRQLIAQLHCSRKNPKRNKSSKADSADVPRLIDQSTQAIDP